MTTHLLPTAEQFAALATLPNDEIVQLLRLVRLKPAASYADGRAATGKQAFETYCSLVDPVFREVGGRRFLLGEFHATIIGPDSEHWDVASLDEYPDAAAVMTMLKNPVCERAAEHWLAAVADARLQCARACQSW